MHHLQPFISHFSHISNLQMWIESWLSSGGPIIIFIITFVEGIPPIGLLSPSHTVVFFAFFLAKIGVLSFSSVIISALLGMILGDISGYFFGKKYGYGFILRLGKFFSIKKESIEKLKDLVFFHINKAVFIGKFNPLTRALAPFVIGSSKVSFRRFIFIDTLANILWTAIALIVGYVFGASYSVVSGYFGRIVVITLIVAILIVLTYRFISKQFHIFAKYELFVLIFNIISLSVFALMLQGISGWHNFMLYPDVAVNIWFSNLVQNMTWLIPTATSISFVFGPIVIAVVSIILSIYFFIKKRWRHFTIITFSMIGGFVFVEFLKNIITSPRPSDAYIHLLDYSFPSGHSAAIAGALVLLVYFFIPKLSSKSWRWFLVSGLSIVTILVGFSRLVLGVHWISDVIAGYSFGIFWTTAMILLVRYGGLLYTIIIEYYKDEKNHKIINSSWGSVARWYDDLVEDKSGSYQSDLILPNLLRLILPNNKDRILDIACGQGFFSRAFAEKGASVVGADISKELINIAIEHSSKNIHFYVTSADKLDFAYNNSFDKAVIVLALQNIENLSGTILEVSRVLKLGGKLFLVINHPSFRVLKNSSWEWDEKSNKQYRRIDSYMTESRHEIDMNPGAKSVVTKKSTVSFHRPLQSYFKALNKTGFAVVRLEEWTSQKESKPGLRAEEENRMRHEIPMFLFLEAVKI